jgi:indole-3-glycerol phosphate synthase
MILDDLAAYARERVRNDRTRISDEEMRAHALALAPSTFQFEKTLAHAGLSFICEIKHASPSKGIIDPAFDPLAITRAYDDAQADCISCLTEPKWFLGSDEIFASVRHEVAIPMLRKDFTVDIYQIYQAHCMGADAVLLICAILDDDTIKRGIELCDAMGMTALVEAHDADEIKRAVRCGARVIGVNNRDLRTFTIDSHRAAHLRDAAPDDVLFVAESGISCAQDLVGLTDAGIDAVLVGEALMRADDKTETLRSFREAARQ